MVAIRFNANCPGSSADTDNVPESYDWSYTLLWNALHGSKKHTSNLTKPKYILNCGEKICQL